LPHRIFSGAVKLAHPATQLLLAMKSQRCHEYRTCTEAHCYPGECD
jgi:hypothetical protein